MYSKRFDEALLSLFSYEQLAAPFTVREYDGDWYVFCDHADGGDEPVGRIRRDPEDGWYYADKYVSEKKG